MPDPIIQGFLRLFKNRLFGLAFQKSENQDIDGRNRRRY